MMTQPGKYRGQAAGRPDADDGRNACSDAPLHHLRTGSNGISLRSCALVLTIDNRLWYRSRLKLRQEPGGTEVLDHLLLPTIFRTICHELCFWRALVYLSLVIRLGAQSYTPALPPAPPVPVRPSPNPNQAVQLPRPGAPSASEIIVTGLCTGDQVCTHEERGDWIYLRGRSQIETSEAELRADELDYNQATGYVEARGKVEYQNFISQERLYADRAEYYAHKTDETGKFYEVSGSAPFRVDTRPGLLTTTNPFYFQAKWAEKVQGEYILHDGYLTDCVIPNPWWTLRGKLFEIYPGDHAVAHKSWFYVRSIPLMYMPKFYKRLEKHPRQSGILLPSGGSNSLKGFYVDGGYYWAISRSYDLRYEGTYFSNVGLQHASEFRGKVNDTTGFDVTINALNDHSKDPRISAGGVYILAEGGSQLGHGWEFKGHLDWLSSFAYRSEFSESINEAVFTQTDSVAFLDKHWSTYGVNLVTERDVNFLSANVGDQVEIRKLPEAQFVVRDHPLLGLPVWFSLDSSGGVLDRTEPDYKTREFVPRTNFVPQLTSSLRLWGVEITPSLAIHETTYGSSFDSFNHVVGSNLARTALDTQVDIALPSLERVYKAPSWMGDKVKHVIEPRITYRYVGGIDNYNQIVRYDQVDLLSDTNQVEFSLSNRLMAKDVNGTVTDLLSWQLYYDRYFNPTFGGAVVPGQPNLVDSVADLTGYTFLYGPRHSSPVVSVLRLQSPLSLDWRTEWDPLRRGFIDTGVNANYRVGNYNFSLGETRVRTNPILLANTDQLRANLTYGNQNRRGLNFGVNTFVDVRHAALDYMSTQASYNTDCCGITLQYRRFLIGSRDEHLYLFSFSISNIGSVGTLNRQQRLF